MFGNDHKDNILKAKMERERDEGSNLIETCVPLFASLIPANFSIFSNQPTNFAKCQSIVANISQSKQYG